MKPKTYTHWLQGKNIGKVKIKRIDKESNLAYDVDGVIYYLPDLKEAEKK
jgi:hypothetical protein